MVRGRTLYQRRARQGYLFIAPALFFVSVLFVFPFFYNVVLTFSDWHVVRPMTYIGLENYEFALTDPDFWDALAHTLYFAVISVPTTIMLALAVAVGLNRIGSQFGSGLLRALYFVPVISSLTAVAYIWAWMFNPAYGLFNELLRLGSLPTLQWLNDTQQVIPSLAIMYVWARLGFDMLILLAGLTTIAPEYYEAARIDGANSWQSFRHITIPMLNRPLVLVAIVETMTALKVFELPFAATAGGPVSASRTLVMHIYETAFKFTRMGEAAVSALALLALILVITLVQRRIFSRHISQ